MDPEVLELNAHSELCSNQEYCLNGGTCYRIPALGRIYCECADSFEGQRCHLKTVGIPDWDMSKNYEEMLLSWNGLLPVAIVVAVAILFMVALFCIYVCAKKCYQKYRITSPVKILRYQNASAQTSISQIYLLGGDNQCNGRLGASPMNPMITSSRTRLIACSTTPDNAEKSLQTLDQSGRPFVDLESGCSGSETDDLLEPVHASKQPCIVLTESDSTDACCDYRRDGTGQGSFSGPPVAESTPSRPRRTNNWQGTSATCLSPNDSNNNRDVFAFNSSRLVVDTVRASCDDRTTLLFQPANCILNNNCGRDSESTSNKAAISRPMSSELYDSDPEATAL